MKKVSRFSREYVFRMCVVAAVGVAAGGCGWFRKEPQTAAARPGASAAGTNGTQLLITATSSGRVESVNQQGKFVVLQFPIGQVPAVNTRMVVYRGDAKVGEVKITGPTEDNLTIADIVLGTVQENDEVRNQ